MHKSACLCLMLAVCLLSNGCLFPWTAKHLERPKPEGQVVLVRGLWGYWPGAESLSRKLRGEGLDTTVVMGVETPGVRDAIIRQQNCRGEDGPLVIVGYSLGANDAITLCQHLATQDVIVDHLVLIDCPYDDAIPDNVVRCTNYYRSRPATDWIPMFRGIPIENASAGTQLENVDVQFDELGCYPWTISHFTICFADAVQQEVVADVVSTFDEFTLEEPRQSDCENVTFHGSGDVCLPMCTPIGDCAD